MDSYSLIADIQQLFSSLDAFLLWVSLHAYSKHYFLLAIIIYWCGYQKVGIRLMCSILISTMFFIFIKPFFNAPRPYWSDTSLFQGVNESGSGMPSGHSQNAVVFWGLSAWSWQKKSFILLALLITGTVALSRIFLGVHFPSQVFAGLATGALILIFWTAFEHRVLAIVATYSSTKKCCLFLILSFLPIAILSICALLLPVEKGFPIQYKDLTLLTGLAAGLSLCFSFLPKREPTLSPCVLLIIQAIPGALIMTYLWQISSVPIASIVCPILCHCYGIVRGLFLAVTAIMIWPLLVDKIYDFTIKRMASLI